MNDPIYKNFGVQFPQAPFFAAPAPAQPRLVLAREPIRDPIAKGAASRPVAYFVLAQMPSRYAASLQPAAVALRAPRPAPREP
jgi:hypothetical protein